MSARIVFVDFEGTGTDPYVDRVVEFAFVDGSTGQAWTDRVNPGVPIPAEATAVHGISDLDVADCPRFSHFAPRIQELVAGAILCGYNIRRYDTVLLHTELRRAGQPGLPCDANGRICIDELDLFALWGQREPRTLVGAAARFAGVDLENAHSAEADTLVLPAVLEGMVRTFGLGGETHETLCRLCIPEGVVDRDGKFRRREDGVVEFNFGPKRGRPVAEEPGLLTWMLGKDFSQETKAVARELLDEIRSRAARPQPELAL